MSYLDERRNQKMFGKPPKQKDFYRMPRVSEKKKAEDKSQRSERGDEETELQVWFNDRRKELTGVCKCGCGKLTSKDDDKNFRASICHIYPKAKFKSVMTHPLNSIELAFWGGCHDNMDKRSVDLWPNMACWEELKQKIIVLSKYLSKEEAATKFHKKLMVLVNKF